MTLFCSKSKSSKAGLISTLLSTTLLLISSGRVWAAPANAGAEEFEIGRLYAATRDYPEAADHYAAALKSDSSNGRYCFELAHAYYNLDQYIQAIPEYTHCLSLHYKPELTYERRAYCYLNSGQYEKGIKDCSEAINLDPQSRIAYFNRAKAYGLIHQKDKQLVDENKIKELDKHPRAKDLFDRGRASHNEAEKFKYFSEALKQDDKDPRIIQAMGATCINLGQVKSAMACFEKLIQLDPKDLTAYFYRGMCYAKLGRDADCQKDLGMVISRAPMCYEAYYWRGTSFLNQKNGKAALADFKKALEIMQPRMLSLYTKKNNDYRKTLGHRLVTTYSAAAKALVLQGQLSQAIDYLTLAVNQSRTVPEVQLQMLQERVALYRQAGRNEEMHKDLASIKEVSDKLDEIKNGPYIPPPPMPAEKEGTKSNYPTPKSRSPQKRPTEAPPD